MPLILDKDDPLSTKVCTRGDPEKGISSKPGRILCVDLKGSLPLVVALTNPDGTEYVRQSRLDGIYDRGDSSNDYDLINAPQEVTLYINVYPDGGHGFRPGTTFYESVEDAKEAGELRAIDTAVAVTFMVPAK